MELEGCYLNGAMGLFARSEKSQFNWRKKTIWVETQNGILIFTLVLLCSNKYIESRVGSQYPLINKH